MYKCKYNYVNGIDENLYICMKYEWQSYTEHLKLDLLRHLFLLHFLLFALLMYILIAYAKLEMRSISFCTVPNFLLLYFGTR